MIEIEANGAAFTIPAELIAEALTLDPAAVPALLRSGAIAVTSEAGIADDDGRFRLTVSNDHTRLRLIIDRTGAIIARSTLDFGTEKLPPGARRPGAT